MRTIRTLLVSIKDAIREISRMRSQIRLERLARRIIPQADWNDLTPAQETLRQLEGICTQAKTSALFFGENSINKRMAAEAIAQRLELPLYRVDLSAVVSKYIGETEKQLRKVFAAAEKGGVILFFDEADALFGKRSDVKDSHDRYADIATNYLLKRMQAYCGLVILAAKKKPPRDDAILRGIPWTVDFSAQGEPYGESSDRH
jgi:SpoVK/Ycf46/Vps4 family AAA+-type ATPase